MKNSKTERRHDAIIKMLGSGNTISVAEFCEAFKSSASTIRNDLTTLAGQGLIIRVLGGAKIAESQPAFPIFDRMNDQTINKKEIACYVVDHLIPLNSTIILDAGTTALEVAKIIAERNIPVSVLTFSLYVSNVLSSSPAVRLFSFGGFYDMQRGAFYDDFIREYAKLLHADLYFMGANGVSPEAGFTIAYRDESITKRTLMSISSKTIALCDSSKLLQNTYRVIADFNEIDTLVTDHEAIDETISKLTAAGLQVLVSEGKEEAN